MVHDLAIDLFVPSKSISLVIREEIVGKTEIRLLQLQTPTSRCGMLWVAGLTVFDRFYRSCIAKDGLSIAKLVENWDVRRLQACRVSCTVTLTQHDFEA